MSHINNKFEFYEVVRILEPDFMPEELWRTEGVILGMSQSDSGIWGYSVMVYSDSNNCWELDEKYLQSTGKKKNREDFYDGTSVRVKVDPMTGRGEVIDNRDFK